MPYVEPYHLLKTVMSVLWLWPCIPLICIIHETHFANVVFLHLTVHECRTHNNWLRGVTIGTMYCYVKHDHGHLSVKYEYLSTSSDSNITPICTYASFRLNDKSHSIWHCDVKEPNFPITKAAIKKKKTKKKCTCRHMLHFTYVQSRWRKHNLLHFMCKLWCSQFNLVKATMTCCFSTMVWKLKPEWLTYLQQGLWIF